MEFGIEKYAVLIMQKKKGREKTGEIELSSQESIRTSEE